MALGMAQDKRRKALGRGLAALIPQAPASSASGGPRSLAVERIRPSKDQPRKVFDKEALEELANSIREHGVLQPVIVRKLGADYQIVAGERRWRASSLAGLQEIPVIIKDLTDSSTLEIALVENIQRQDLDPLEEAEAYHRLAREHGRTQEDISKAVGKSRAAVANTMRLLKLPRQITELLAAGSLTAGHARALMTLDDDADMLKLALDAVRRRASVRDTESRAKMMKRSTNRSAKTIAQPTPAERSVTERVTRALGTKVEIKQRKGKGTLEIHFHSLDQLDDLLNRIAP